MRVVRLTPSDVDLARATFATMARTFEEAAADLDDDYLRALLTNESFWAFAAVGDDEPLGGLTAHVLPMTNRRARELFLFDIAVRPESQRRGIGKALVDALRAAGHEAGIETTFVLADDEDRHALDFYQAQGGAPSPVTLFAFETPAPLIK